jgi:transcriptional regulator with XRE-family HTH domain
VTIHFRCRRPNPVFSDEYRALLDVVRQARRQAGLSQRALAQRLGKAQSHIGMIERGQRRIDSLELYFMAKAVGVEPEALFEQIARRVDAVAAAAA